MAFPLDNLRLVYDEKNDAVCAILLPSKKPIVCVPVGPIRARVTKAIAEYERKNARPRIHGYELGGPWGFLKRQAKQVRRVTMKIASRKTLDMVRKIANDPRVAQGLGLASAVFPPLGVTYGTIRAGSALIDKVHAGDLNAQKLLVAVAVKAAKEGPGSKADAVRKTLLFLHKVRKNQEGPLMAPETQAALKGWAYNRPYRSAAEGGWNLRDLYRRGGASHPAGQQGPHADGWLYNRPYRNPADAAAQDRWSPRSLYQRGLASHGG